MGTALYSTCLIALSFVSCQAEDQLIKPENYVEIYSESAFEGVMEQVNLTSSCNSVAEFLLAHGQIRSIHSKDNCINVYQDEDCSGVFITLKPGNPFHYALHLWRSYYTRAKAIGPCYDACHESKIELGVETATVELFKEKDFEGTSERETIRQRTCSLLSKEMQGVIMSFKVKPRVCIELHEFENCSGVYRDFPVVSPSHNNLQHWDYWEKMRVESISLCGYRCHDTKDATDFFSASNIPLNNISETPINLTASESYHLEESHHTTTRPEASSAGSGMVTTLTTEQSGSTAGSVRKHVPSLNLTASESYHLEESHHTTTRPEASSAGSEMVTTLTTKQSGSTAGSVRKHVPSLSVIFLSLLIKWKF